MICYKCMNQYNGEVCNLCGFDSRTYQPIPTALMPETLLRKNYLLGRVLGKGGFGITYIAYDFKGKRRVAIKEYFPSSIVTRDATRTTKVETITDAEVYHNTVQKFYNEAKILSQLNDVPAIVKIYDFFCENNTAYIVMEYIAGHDVSEIVKSEGKQDLTTTFNIYYPIMEALEAVHARGILHRDLSPTNIRVDKHFRPKLLDFGSARAYSDQMSVDMTVFLKEGFTPIEQYQRSGKHKPTEDIYALCASIYYTLTGKIPPNAFDRTTFDTIKPFSSFGVQLPEAMERVIMKGLAVYAEMRYQSVTDLMHDFKEAFIGIPQEPTSVDPAQAEPGQAVPGRADPRQGMPGHADPGQAVPGRADPGQAVPGRGDPGRADPGSDPYGSRP
nr:protein kinase [Lachnospiraceae bacterium]